MLPFVVEIFELEIAGMSSSESSADPTGSPLSPQPHKSNLNDQGWYISLSAPQLVEESRDSSSSLTTTSNKVEEFIQGP